MASSAKYLRACSVTQSCLTLWTVARQAPLSMGLLREEYWSGLPFPPPQDLPDPGIEPRSPAGQVDSLLLSHWGSPIIREMQVKTPVSRHLTLVRRPSSKGVQIIHKCWRGCGGKGTPPPFGGHENWHIHSGEDYGGFLKN